MHTNAMFTFPDEEFVSEPFGLNNDRIASCLLFGNETVYAVILCSDEDGANLDEYLFTKEQFQQLDTRQNRQDLETALRSNGKLISQPIHAKQREEGKEKFESKLSVRTRKLRVEEFDKIGAEMFDIDGEFEETAAEIQTKHEAELSLRLRPNGENLDKEIPDKMLKEANPNGDIPPIQTSSINIPGVVKATTSITYARLQLPDGEGNLAKVMGPVHMVRFDFVELNNSLYRETITYEAKVQHYIETFRKEVLKEASFGFGLALGVGAVPAPPGNSNATNTGDDRYEKGKKVEKAKDPKDPKGLDSQQRFKPGFGISISAGMSFKKHRLTEYSIDDFVASVTPIERVVDKLH